MIGTWCFSRRKQCSEHLFRTFTFRRVVTARSRNLLSYQVSRASQATCPQLFGSLRNCITITLHYACSPINRPRVYQQRRESQTYTHHHIFHHRDFPLTKRVACASNQVTTKPIQTPRIIQRHPTNLASTTKEINPFLNSGLRRTQE